MSDISLTHNFLVNSTGFTLKDGGGATWSFDPASNGISVSLTVAAGSVADNAITNAKLADMAQATIKGRAAGAGTGDPTDLSASQVKTILAVTSADVSDFTEAAQDATGSLIASSATIAPSYNDVGNSLTLSIIDGTVTYAKIQNVSATNRVLGRISAGAGTVEELTGANLATLVGYVGANPSASVGLTAVNGTATTYMRSDGSPALSMTITPNWSGTHTFSKSATTALNGAQLITSALPLIGFNQTGAAANNAVWALLVSGEQFIGTAYLDTGGSGVDWLEVDRTSTTIDQINLLATQILATGKFKTTGNVGFNNTAPIAKPSVTGSRAANAALASLLTALASYGLITDSTTA